MPLRMVCAIVIISRQSSFRGQPDKAAKINRVPAVEIEKLILSAVRKHLAGKPDNEAEAEDPDLPNDKELISIHVARVDVKRDHLPSSFGQRGAGSSPSSRTRRARSSRSSCTGPPLEKDFVKTTAGDYSPRVDIASSRPPSNPRRNPRQARHRPRKGAALAR